MGTLLRSLACITLFCFVAGRLGAYNDANVEETAQAGDESLEAPTAVESLSPPTEGEPAIPPAAEEAAKSNPKENFVLRLTVTKERVIQQSMLPTPEFGIAPRRTATTVPAPLPGSARRGNAPVPRADINSTPASRPVVAPRNTIASSTNSSSRTIMVTEQLELFCEDVQVSAKLNEAGTVVYSLTCKGHVRIKGQSSTIVGTDATFENNVIKLKSAEITTGDAVIKTSEIEFEFPLTGLQINKAGEAISQDGFSPFNPPNPFATSYVPSNHDALVLPNIREH